MKGQIRWMNQNGDSITTFDTELQNSTEEALTAEDAEEFLKQHQKAGRLVYNTRDKTLMQKFDPSAETYIVTPQMAGGSR